jgi:hypothetical protein
MVMPVAAVVHQPGTLKLSGSLGHTVKPHPKHVGEQSPRQAHLVRRQSIETEQQLSTEVLVRRVALIKDTGLRYRQGRVA